MKLRHQAIAFVSAGTNTPTEKKEDILEEADIVAALVDEDDEVDSEDDLMEDTMVDDVDNSALDNTMVTDTDVEMARDTKAMHIHEHIEAPIPALDGAMDALPEAAPASTSKPPTPPQETLSFVIDTEGDPSLSRPHHSQAKVPVRPSSPTPSDSSEEVILFHGRNKPKVVEDPVTSSRDTSTRRQAPKASKPQIAAQQPPPKVPIPNAQPSPAHVTDALLAALGQPASSTPEARGWGAKEPKWNQQMQATPTDFTPAPPGSWWKNQGMPRPDLGPSPEEKMAFDGAAPKTSKVAFAPATEEDNGASDTIASLQADWDRTRREKKRSKQAVQEQDDGFETVDEDEPSESATKVVHRAVAHDLGAKTSRRGKRGRKRSNKLLKNLQSDQTDDEEAAYIDYMENLKAQLEADEQAEISGIRSADGGPSLVVDGQVIDENELLNRSTRDVNFDELRMMDTESGSDDEEIGLDIDDFDEDDDDEDPSEFDSSDLESELEYDEREQWEDEEDLRQRRIAAMDDETLARLYAKQAELGISDEDLVIDDGRFIEDLDEFGDVDEARAGLEDLAKSSFGRSTTKRSNKKSGGMNFPNASAMADTLDQYGDAGFDIMDFERPSLRVKRGRKGKVPPELDALSDDDLKNEMLGHWSNDREKKRLKKAEREELRMQGLLGASVAKKGKANLSQKYVQGMTVPQIHDEIRIFLQDVTQTTRSFPPMDKHDRKSLHEIASVLNLKSKSTGAGKNRAPVLYKTSRTPEYTDATFKRITTAANKGFLKNSAFKGKKPKGGPMQRGGKGRGADMSSTGLKHGDVVGGGAKEIGRENFGHRLMEKMGWQTGTALGKDGSGMLTPVEQIMRTGRSGLG